jgi:ATP-dependent DNA helicase UvrD/PcrA
MQLELNKEQQKAVNFQNGICVVIATPGSGKTLTMTHRICNLVKMGVAPENILAVSFTRNAAAAMKEKLAPILNDLADRVTLSTIHSFCHYILRNDGRTFEVISGKDQIVLMRDVMKQLKIKDLSIGMVLREISLAKNNMISIDEFHSLYEGDKSMQKIADIFELYDREKERKYLLDLDDLLVEAFRLLRENEDVREKYKGTFRHLLVDEYQDVNIIQDSILRILVNDSESESSYFVVGDEMQAIYGFTGASVSGILNFRNVFPTAEQIIMNWSYRSTPQIVRACQNLIKHNQKKIDKELKTNNPDGEEIIVLESSSEMTESITLVNEIKELVDRRDFNYTDIAVLYRCNFQSRVLEEAFSQAKIPYYIENGLCFYDRREVKLLLDYLSFISNPYSDKGDEALRSIINVPNRYIGRRFMKELDEFQSNTGRHLYNRLKDMPIGLPYIRKNVKDFIQFMEPLINEAENFQPAELIRLLRTSLDYDRFITDSDLPTPDDVKIENLNQLQLASARFSDIESFLKHAESFQEESVSDNKEGVRLMTIHKSKGLEFPVVFVAGLVENILPSKQGQVDEERRCAFVALSRAMKLLYLSWSLTYLGQPSKKSRFLSEILDEKKPQTAS